MNAQAEFYKSSCLHFMKLIFDNDEGYNTYREKTLRNINEKLKGGQELSFIEIKLLKDLFPLAGKKDEFIEEVLKLRDVKKGLSSMTGYEESEISLNKKEALAGGIKLHFGDLRVEKSKVNRKYSYPENISGAFSLVNFDSLDGVLMPKSIGGEFYIFNLGSPKGLKLPRKLKDLKFYNLKSAEGLEFSKKFKGNLSFIGIKSTKGLKLPKFIEGDFAMINNLAVDNLTPKDLRSPQKVGGDFIVENIFLTNKSVFPKEVGGNFSYSMEFGKVHVGIDYEDFFPTHTLSEKEVESFTLLRHFDFPEKVGKNFSIRGFHSVSYVNLPKTVEGNFTIEGFKIFSNTILPDGVNGRVILKGSRIDKGVFLPKHMGRGINIDAQEVLLLN